MDDFFDLDYEPPGVCWYRMYETASEHDVHIYTEALPVIRETECGVWLDLGGSVARRFVLKDARKRWACPTREEAEISFIARKKRQLRILRAHVLRVERALNAMGRPV